MTSEFGLTLAAFVLLLFVAGLVQRWPRIGRVLVVIVALWFAAGLTVFIVRGDLFRASGVEADTTNGCSWVLVC